MSCNIDEIRVSEETERPTLPNLHPEIDIGILNPSGLQRATTKNLGKVGLSSTITYGGAPASEHLKIIMSLPIEILNQNLNTVPIIFWEFHIANLEAVFSSTFEHPSYHFLGWTSY